MRADPFRGREKYFKEPEYDRKIHSPARSSDRDHQFHGKRKLDVIGRHHRSRDNSSYDDDEERFSRGEEEGDSVDDDDDDCGSDDKESEQARAKEDIVFNPFHNDE